MRHGIFRILKGNVKLIHLCVCMGVYMSTEGGIRGIMCVGVVFCEYMGRSEEGRGSNEREKERMHVKLKSKATYHACRLPDLSLCAFQTASFITCQHVMEDGAE